MANVSITARIIVMPSRTSIFCFRLSSPCCGSILSPTQNDLIVKNKRVASTPISKFWQPSRARAILRGHRRISLLGSVENETAIISEPVKKNPGRGRGF
jgi:hypothetical protein